MLIRLSYAVGLTALAILVVMPERWVWSVFLILGNGVFLGMMVMCPRCRMMGANIVRLPSSAMNRGEIALTFDDGPDVVVTPLVLEILDRFGVKASFFCIGEKAAAHPSLLKEIISRGHSVENHSYHHRYMFAFYRSVALKREVVSTQKLFSEHGVTARFFRAPMGFRSPLLNDVLDACQLEHVAWTRRGFDAVRSNADAVFLRLARTLSPGDILLLHDGGSARTRDGRPVVLAVLPELLERCKVLGLHSVSLPMAFRDRS